jgi:di/tricarboxylate transporter
VTTDAWIAFAVVAASLVMFASDRLRLDVVALIALLSLAITRVAPLDVALSGFSNPAVLMIAGLFVVGAGMTETGIADWLGRRLERYAGQSETRVLVAIVCLTALLSSVMSSTGTVALLLPVVGTIAGRRGIPPARLLMPLAFAAHLGSNLTLISTPPNIIVSDALREAGREPFRFFSFIVPGIAALLVGVGYLALIGRRALRVADAPLSRRPALSERDLATEYGLGEALTSVRISERSKLAGMTLGEANLRADLRVTVIGITRGGAALRLVPSVTLAAGDELRVIGSSQQIRALCAAFSTELVPAPSSFALPLDESLAEVLVPRRSRLVGRTLAQARFRDRYRATALALRRVEGQTPVCHGEAALRDLVLRAGDTLLLKGRRKYLRNLRDERADLLLMAEPDMTADVLVDRPRAYGAIAITLAMLVVMAFGWLPNVIAVLLAVVLLVLTGCVRTGAIYRSVNWESVVLIACLIPLATTLERTGGTQLIVNAVLGPLETAPPTAILALLVVITSAFGMLLSNTATAVLVAPMAVRLASGLGIAPEPLLMGVAFAASAAYATPVASPVNALVMVPGGYRFRDFTRVGLPLQLLVLATAVLVIPLVWPF